MTEKRCTKCLNIKPYDEFYKDPKGKDGLYAACRTCHAIATNKWRTSHREKANAIMQHYRCMHPEKVKEGGKTYRKNNPEKIKAGKDKWTKEHPQAVKKIQKRHNAKIMSTTKGQLNKRMRTGINCSLCQGVKNSRGWEKLVGYTVEQLKIHLEKQFKQEMTWEKFMAGKIHIDHKIPISAFNKIYLHWAEQLSYL